MPIAGCDLVEVKARNRVVAEQRNRKICREIGRYRRSGLLHCRLGDCHLDAAEFGADRLDEAHAAGVRALQIRRLAAELPDDAHMLETDAPDIAPAWQPRERNSPTQLPRIAQVFADLRETTTDEVVRRTGENAVRVLPRLGALLRA
ncbi:MAG: TatD family hydrolase [Burkholderiaceae bacterium]